VLNDDRFPIRHRRALAGALAKSCGSIV
jgi:hypothetical protein